MNNQLSAMGYKSESSMVETNLQKLVYEKISAITSNVTDMNQLSDLIVSMLTDKGYMDNTFLAYSIPDDNGGHFSLIISKEFFGKNGGSVYLPKCYFINQNLKNSNKVQEMDVYKDSLSNTNGIYDRMIETLDNSLALIGHVFNEIYKFLQNEKPGNYSVNLTDNFYVIYNEGKLSLHFTGKFKMKFKNDSGLNDSYQM